MFCIWAKVDVKKLFMLACSRIKQESSLALH